MWAPAKLLFPSFKQSIYSKNHRNPISRGGTASPLARTCIENARRWHTDTIATPDCWSARAWPYTGTPGPAPRPAPPARGLPARCSSGAVQGSHGARGRGIRVVRRDGVNMRWQGVRWKRGVFVCTCGGGGQHALAGLSKNTEPITTSKCTNNKTHNKSKEGERQTG